MQAYRVETEIQPNGMFLIEHIPFHAGQPVEVIILVRSALPDGSRYPLRGLPIQYDYPFKPVAAHEWDAL